MGRMTTQRMLSSPEHVDIHRLADQQQYQQRGKERCQERGRGRHADRQRQVSFCQIGNDVGGGAARAASDQDDADGERFVQAEQARERKGEQRHHRELRQAADKHVFGTGEHHAEVLHLERQAHAEHDHAQQGIDERRLQVPHYLRERKCQDGRYQDQHPHPIRNPFADLFHDEQKQR